MLEGIDIIGLILAVLGVLSTIIGAVKIKQVAQFKKAVDEFQDIAEEFVDENGDPIDVLAMDRAKLEKIVKETIEFVEAVKAIELPV